MTNVETIKIDLDDGDVAANETLTFSTSGMTGLSTVTIVDASSTTGQEDIVNVTNLAAGVGVGITNGDANWRADFDLSDATGTADAITLSLTAAKADLVTIAGVETVTVDAVSGTSTLDAITIAAAKTLNMTGAGNVTFTAMTGSTALTKIDGSAATGDISLNLAALAAVSIAGGAGNDTIDFTTNTIATTDTVTGGDGTDRIIVATAQTTALTNVTGVEELAFVLADTANTDFEIDASVITGLTTVVIAAEQANGNAALITVSNLSDTQSVVIEDANADSDSADGIDLTLTSATDTTTNVASLTLSGIGVIAASHSTTGISTVTVDNIETVALVSNANSDGTVTTNGIEALAASGTKTLTVTGAADLTITGIVNTTALTSLDASAASGKFTISGLDASALSFKGAVGANTVGMAGLNATDTVVGGAATTDALTATAVTGLSATTGKLNVTAFETVNLQATGANTIDASLMTGLTTLAFSGATPGTQTVTGLAAGVAIGIGDSTAVFDSSATISVALADATGTADTLTFSINNSAHATNTDASITTTGIESLTLKVNATTANDAQVLLTNAAATSVTVTGGSDGTVLTVGALNKATTTFDASGMSGIVSVSAAAATAGVTISTAAFETGGSITGSSLADTITVASTGAVAATIDGGAGKDTLNLSVKTGYISTASITNTEYINLAVRAGDDIIIGANANEVNGIDTATTLTVTGGNELSTLTIGDATDTLADTTPTLLTIDASAFSGNIALLYAAEALTADVVIKGGALTTDSVTASYDATGSNIAATLDGIETLNLTFDASNDGSESYTTDLTNFTGLTSLVINTGTAAVTHTTTGYTSSTTVQLGQTVGTAFVQAASAITVTHASSTGTADALKVKLVDTNAGNTTVALTSAGTETLSLSVNAANEAHSISLAGVAATSGSTLTTNITGGYAAADLTITAFDATARVIDASVFIGDLVISDRGSSAMTITGGTGGDTLRMENTADVIDGGADTGDTLVIAQNAVLGGFAIDLSSTVDQVTTYNGSANAAVQKGFLSVNLSGITGVFGADVTANSVGSTITGTANGDVLTGGDGVDTFIFAAGAAGTAAVANNAVTGHKDVITWSTTNDILNFTALGVSEDLYVETTTAISAVTNNDVVVVNAAATAAGKGFANSIAEFDSLWSANGATALNTTGSLASVGDKAIVITAQDATNSTGLANVWFIQEVGGTDGFTSAEDFIQLIGTINVGTAGTGSTITGTLAAANFN